MSLSVVLASFVCGLGATWLLRLYAIRADLMDEPNERSSHSIATPRGGGLSIVIAVLGFLLLLMLELNGVSKGPVTLFVTGSVVAGVGFIDDHRHVHAGIRFACHTMAAATLVVSAGGLAPVPFGGALIDLGIVGGILAVVFIVWFTNLFNFMDGIDGIAGVETVSIAGGILLLTGMGPGVQTDLLTVIVAATAGFLIWNWPPAKIFMGDVGSGFLGFFLAGIAILSTEAGETTVWPWLILSGVFIVDATVTLLMRMLRGDSWHSAHRLHAYQILSRKSGGHAIVSSGVFIINACWLLPLAWLANNSAGSGWWLTVIAWMPLAVAALLIGAGKPDYA